MALDVTGRRRRLLRWLVIGSVAIACMPVRRVALSEWTVSVVDESGRGVPGIDVAQSWEDYSFDGFGDRSNRTDSAGRVVFSTWTRWRPLGYFALRRIGVLINPHSSVGRVGRVWVPHDPRVQALEPGKGTSAFCADRTCVVAPQTTILTVRVIR
jgi:hypothetical protein